MNIEKERKAFEENTKAKYPGASLARVKSGAYYNWHVDSAFNGWLDAKKHAAEMAKPIADVRKRKDHHQWAVYVPTSLTAEAFDFSHKQDAVAWAVERGYRVIE